MICSRLSNKTMKIKKLYLILGIFLLVIMGIFLFIFFTSTPTITTNLIFDDGQGGEIEIKEDSCFMVNDKKICKIGIAQIEGGKTIITNSNITD